MKILSQFAPQVAEIRLEPHDDERGFFARAWCRDEMAAAGLTTAIAQVNLAFNERRFTLRGMHFQVAPHGEAKYFRCVRGAVYAVIVDLRSDSPACGRWSAWTISSDQRNMLHVPEGTALGYQTLEDAAEVMYFMSAAYVPNAGRGFRFNDPRFGVTWPQSPSVISQRDLDWPDYEPPAPH